MSKGSAGKVYFVLYLAVILELLIIIVERDEAEEHLHQKTKESMKIVQNILSQLQSGSGNFNMNVAPNDLIIVQDKATVESLPPDQRIKRQKTYSVKVGVTDISEAKKGEGAEDSDDMKDYTFTKLANVQELTYQLFYTETPKGENQENAPRLPDGTYNGKLLRDFKAGDVAPYRDSVTGKVFDWTLLDARQLKLDVPATYNYNKAEGGWRKPLYNLIVNNAPLDKITQLKDTVFFYDSVKSEKDIVNNANRVLSRTFTVNFDPGDERKDGWYKLRFFSSTNKILGVDFDGGMKEIKDDDQVNVGVVKLKMKALKSVLKELQRELDGKMELRDRWFDGEGDFNTRYKAVEEFNQAVEKGRKDNADSDEILNKITLYDYIVKLMTPGFSSFLDQNSGTMDIDVQVRKPEQQQPAPSISELESKIITFDKLQKTIITFSLTPATYFKPGNPDVEFKGTPSLAGKYKIEPDEATASSSAPFDPQANNKKRRYRMVFEQPIPAGEYNIKLTYSGGGKSDTASTDLKVLPSSLEAKSMRSLGGMKLYFGKRLSLRSKLQAEAEIPLAQFKIDYQLGNEKKNTDNPYQESWVGPNVPASAKKVKADIVWVYPATGERVPLFSREITPEQSPPDILCMNATAEMRSSGAVESPKGRKPSGKKPIQPNNFEILVKGVSVDYEVPVDADNKDLAASKSIKATLDDVEPNGDADIDYTSTDTKLIIYNGDEPDPTSTWQPTATTFQVISGGFDNSAGVFPIVIAVKDLPPKPPAETRILKGTIVVRAGARIVNRKAGSSASANGTCIITINIPYR